MKEQHFDKITLIRGRTGRWHGVAIPQGGAICHMLTTGGIVRTNFD